jgi:hypothetical protein
MVIRSVQKLQTALHAWFARCASFIIPWPDMLIASVTGRVRQQRNSCAPTIFLKFQLTGSL